MHRRHLFCGGFLFGFLAACASHVSEPVEEAPAPIVTGEETKAHAWVVGVCQRGIFGGCDAICSGSLIAPNLVLTARHCVESYERVPAAPQPFTCASRFLGRPLAEPGRFRITTDATIGTGQVPVRRVLTTSGESFCGNDAALLVLERPIPPEVAIPARPALAPHAAGERSEVAVIGYGVTGPSATGGGRRRVREHVGIACIPGDPGRPCTADGDLFHHEGSEEFAGNDFLTTEGPCNGDSGGPAVDQAALSAGGPVVVGIVSRVGRGAGQCTFGIYTRLDGIASFLRAGVRDAAEGGGYPLPGWALD